MGFVTRDQVAQARDYELEVVEVPDWGGEIAVRTMQIAHRDEMQIHYLTHAAAPSSNGTALSLHGLAPDCLRDLKVLMLSFCLCDEQGELLFHDDEGRAILRRRNGPLLDRLYAVALRVNHMTEESFEQEKKDLLQTLSAGS